MTSTVSYHDPAAMTAAERRAEVARILAAGGCRVLAQKGRNALDDLARPVASWDPGAAVQAPAKEVA